LSLASGGLIPHNAIRNILGEAHTLLAPFFAHIAGWLTQ
jgi:hypothetical protein